MGSGNELVDYSKRHVGSGNEIGLDIIDIKSMHSRPQRPRSFWSAPRIATRFLVLTKRSAASGDENEVDVDTSHKSIQNALEKLEKSKSGFKKTAVSNFKSKKHERTSLLIILELRVLVLTKRHVGSRNEIAKLIEKLKETARQHCLSKFVASSVFDSP